KRNSVAQSEDVSKIGREIIIGFVDQCLIWRRHRRGDPAVLPGAACRVLMRRRVRFARVASTRGNDMKRWSVIIAAVVVVAAGLLARPGHEAAAQGNGWITLFDGETL